MSTSGGLFSRRWHVVLWLGCKLLFQRKCKLLSDLGKLRQPVSAIGTTAAERLGKALELSSGCRHQARFSPKQAVSGNFVLTPWAFFASSGMFCWRTSGLAALALSLGCRRGLLLFSGMVLLSSCLRQAEGAQIDGFPRVRLLVR